MITAGIDCGAKNTKTIIMKDGQVIGKGMVLITGLVRGWKPLPPILTMLVGGCFQPRLNNRFKGLGYPL